jgi:hypothetical protein
MKSATNKANKKQSQQTIDLNINGTTYGIVNPGSSLGQIQKCHVIKLGIMLSAIKMMVMLEARHSRWV